MNPIGNVTNWNTEILKHFSGYCAVELADTVGLPCTIQCENGQCYGVVMRGRLVLPAHVHEGAIMKPMAASVGGKIFVDQIPVEKCHGLLELGCAG